MRADKLPGEGYQERQPLAVADGRMSPLSQLAPVLPQTPSSALSRPLPHTAVGSDIEASPGSGREREGAHANFGNTGAEITRTSTQRGRVEVCNTGAVAGLVCDLPPTSAETSSFNSSQPVPGRIPSTATAASAQANRDCGNRQNRIEGKPPTIENRLADPSEREIGSNGGAGNGSDNTSKPDPTSVRFGSLLVEGTSHTTPLPRGIEEPRREEVPQTSPKASMEHLRKAALATVSLSAQEDEEDAGIARGNGVDQATENRSRSAFAESEPSSSPSSSSHSPSSPCRFFPRKGVGVPEADTARVQPTTQGPTPSGDTKPSTLEPVRNYLSSGTHGDATDTEEAAGNVVLSNRAAAPSKDLETVERESDSSFSVEDERAGETPVETDRGRVERELQVSYQDTQLKN